MASANDPASVFTLIDMRGRDECWRWLGSWGGRDRNKRPYYMTENKRWIAYRLVYHLVYGVKLSTEEKILHACDNGQWPMGCCNPFHLRVGTTRENAVDMMLRQRHGLSRITVRAIRRLLEKGRSHDDIAELYGVARTTVVAIAVGRTHLAVTDEEVEREQARHANKQVVS